MDYSEEFNGGLRLFVRVTPGASKDEIAGEWRGAETMFGPDTRLSIKVAAPPTDGKANAAVIKLLAKHYGAPKSAVSIVCGETSRLKTVEIRGA